MQLIDSFNSLYNTYNKYLNENIITDAYADLSMNAYQYIVVIYDKKEITTTALANILGLKKSSVTQMLQSLEEKGYVEKLPSDSDKRSTLIKLTPKGNDVMLAEEKAITHFESKIKKILTEKELLTLESLFLKLAEGIANDDN